LGLRLEGQKQAVTDRGRAGQRKVRAERQRVFRYFFDSETDEIPEEKGKAIGVVEHSKSRGETE